MWSIVSPEKYPYISVKFKTLDIGAGDYIDISGSKIPEPGKSISLYIGNWMTLCFADCVVTFQSDNQFSGKGFLIDIISRQKLEGK